MINLAENLVDPPFVRLSNFLNKIQPPKNDIIDLSIGQPRHNLPNILFKTMKEYENLWNIYPPVDGTLEYRIAVASWLTKRYALKKDYINPNLILPVSGTREGLYSLVQMLTATRNSAKATKVGMPNPCFQTYYAATIMSGVEPVLFPAHKQNNFLPDLNDLNPKLCNQLILFFLCSPGNPQGMFASYDYIKTVIELAKKYNFVAVFDECYSEIYIDKPPIGALEVCNKENLSLENVLILNSMSKRSSAAGLRSGFMIGGDSIIKSFSKIRTLSCAGMPLPIIKTTIALLNDEKHVEKNRSQYREKFLLSQKIFKNYPGFYLPEGTIFLWVDVGNGELMTEKLWTNDGIKVLPGSFSAMPDKRKENPGNKYIRIAMVENLEKISVAMEKIKARISN